MLVRLAPVPLGMSEGESAVRGDLPQHAARFPSRRAAAGLVPSVAVCTGGLDDVTEDNVNDNYRVRVNNIVDIDIKRHIF